MTTPRSFTHRRLSDQKNYTLENQEVGGSFQTPVLENDDGSFHAFSGTNQDDGTFTGRGGSNAEQNRTKESLFGINIQQAGLTAAFSADVTDGAPPLTVVFTSNVGGIPTRWFWDFGDGQHSRLENPTHTYAEEGTYTVKLVATNADGGDVLEEVDYITVSSGPTTGYYIRPESAPLYSGNWVDFVGAAQVNLTVSPVAGSNDLEVSGGAITNESYQGETTYAQMELETPVVSSGTITTAFLEVPVNYYAELCSNTAVAAVSDRMILTCMVSATDGFSIRLNPNGEIDFGTVSGGVYSHGGTWFGNPYGISCRMYLGVDVSNQEFYFGVGDFAGSGGGIPKIGGYFNAAIDNGSPVYLVGLTKVNLSTALSITRAVITAQT